jgi:ribonuclease HI
MMSEEIAEVYTDGSCHTQQKLGTWVAIIFTGMGRKVLSGTIKDTTHNRMELTAVLNALEYIKTHYENITTINVLYR